MRYQTRAWCVWDNRREQMTRVVCGWKGCRREGLGKRAGVSPASLAFKWMTLQMQFRCNAPFCSVTLSANRPRPEIMVDCCPTKLIYASSSSFGWRGRAGSSAAAAEVVASQFLQLLLTLLIVFSCLLSSRLLVISKRQRMANTINKAVSQSINQSIR